MKNLALIASSILFFVSLHGFASCLDETNPSCNHPSPNPHPPVPSGPFYECQVFDENFNYAVVFENPHRLANGTIAMKVVIKPFHSESVEYQGTVFANQAFKKIQSADGLFQLNIGEIPESASLDTPLAHASPLVQESVECSIPRWELIQ